MNGNLHSSRCLLVAVVVALGMTAGWMPTAFASGRAGGPFGVGLVVGEPTGLTAKYWLSEDNAIDGAVGWSGDHLHLHANYLWHKFGILKADSVAFDFYFGAGGRIFTYDSDGRSRNRDKDGDTYLGVRAPVGLRYQFPDPAIEVFVELALVMDLIPETDADLDFGIGGRFFF